MPLYSRCPNVLGLVAVASAQEAGAAVRRGQEGSRYLGTARVELEPVGLEVHAVPSVTHDTPPICTEPSFHWRRVDDEAPVLGPGESQAALLTKAPVAVIADLRSEGALCESGDYLVAATLASGDIYAGMLKKDTSHGRLNMPWVRCATDSHCGDAQRYTDSMCVET